VRTSQADHGRTDSAVAAASTALAAVLGADTVGKRDAP